MPPATHLVLPDEQIHRILKAIADPRRYEILMRLRECDSTVSCASVRGCMAITPATLSHHMKELETAGIVRVAREQKFANYTLRRDVLSAFLRQLKADLA